LTFNVTNNIKSTVSSCKTLRNDDVSSPSSKCSATVEFLETGTPAFISPILWLPNSPDLNHYPIDYSVCSMLKEKMPSLLQLCVSGVVVVVFQIVSGRAVVILSTAFNSVIVLLR